MGQSADQFKLPPMETSTLLIFQRSTPDAEYTTEQRTEMQNGHLANLTRLYNEKKAPAAGPFGDKGDDRGFVILRLPRQKVAAEFEADPFVMHGLLRVRLYTFAHMKDAFTWPDATTFEMGEFVFGIYTKGEKWKASGLNDGGKAQMEHVKRNFQMCADGLCGLIGPLTDSTDDWRGVAFFQTKDQAEILKRTEDDPLIKAGHLKLVLKPLYMGKRLFKPYKP